MDYSALCILDYVKGIKTKKFTATQAVAFFVERCKNDKKNAILETFDSWKLAASAIDEKVKSGKPLGRLAGVPIVIKDNILYKDHRSSGASLILGKFVAPFTATLVDKLVTEDAVIIARANMDMFGMGGGGFNSAYGKTLNAIDETRPAGGSSSGSAVAAAMGYCLAAIGTDTGGSCRMPATMNNIAGIKPTYGLVSRFGLMAYGSSLEGAGVLAKTIDDAAVVLDVISGDDKNDMTSRVAPKANKKLDLKKLRIGRINSPHSDSLDPLLDSLKKSGAVVTDIDLDPAVLPAYYTIAWSEASSNLGRLDGVFFTGAAEAEGLEELYKKTRSSLLGSEVKRRIILGNYMLASGYYTRAISARARIRAEFDKHFEKIDLVIMPIICNHPDNNPLKNYLDDMYTVLPNMICAPAIAIPSALPFGLQIMGRPFDEENLINVANYIQKQGVQK